MDRIEKQSMLESLFEEAIIEQKNFKRHTYQDLLTSLLNKYQSTFLEIAEEYHQSGDDLEILNSYASVLANSATKKIEGLNKRKRDTLILDCNMSMVIFVIPLIAEIREQSMDLFADCCIECWNNTLPNTSIGKATKDSIQGGFKKGICYITTAVCQQQMKADDCYELSLLREYRDGYLMRESQEGKAIIEEYYNVAPTIVKRINKEANSDEIYQNIWKTYLQPCISDIEQKHYEECKETYVEMVHTLANKYIY